MKKSEINKKESRSKNSGRKQLGFSYTIKGEKIQDEELVKKLNKYQENIDEMESNYGYRKMKYHLLKELGIIINHKKLYRLCKENNLLKNRIKKSKPQKNLSKNQVVSGSNQLWELDIKYIKIDEENKFSYLCCVIDVFDKTVIEYYLGLNCKATDISLLLKNAYKKREITNASNLKIRTDNGTQFVSKKFKETCDELGLYHERIPNATPNKNAHIESFFSIVEFELVTKYYFSYYSEVYERVTKFINDYNNKRIHSSIGYRTPNEYYSLIKNNLIECKPIKIA